MIKLKRLLLKQTNVESRLSSLEPFKEILPLISGSVLLLLATPPYGFFPLAYIALAVALLSLRKNTRGFLKGFIFGLIYNLFSMYWIIYVLGKYGNLPFPVSTFLFLLLAAYLSIYPAIFFKIAEKTRDKLPVIFDIALLSLTWVGLEFVRANFLTGFPWMLIGYTQYNFLAVAQTVSVVGIYGLGFIIVFSNLCFFNSLSFFSDRKKTGLLPATVAILVVISASWYGVSRIEALKKKLSGKRHLDVMCVQGNIDQSEKWEKGLQRGIIQKYAALSLDGLKRHRADLVIWPETAIPFIYGLDPDLTEHFKDILKNEEFPPLITGYPGFKWDENGKMGFTNSAGIFIGGEPRERYDKTHLVPFGEYVPLKKILFFVNKLVTAAGDFLPGDSVTSFHVADAAVGILICYEAIFPEITREVKKNGGVFIVNITNDAWFGNSSAPYQHYAMSSFRAIESESYLVRVANTGISGIITPWGEDIVKTSLFTEAVFSGRIYY